MIKVGLIGESPYDTEAIHNLLSKYYKNSFQFVKLLKRVTGNELESLGKMKRLLSAEVKNEADLSYIIYIRDLDALEDNREAVLKRTEWFNKVKATVDTKSIFLLNIVELEALILADIQSFNKKYKTNIKFNGDPMRKTYPKEFLMQQTRNNKKQFKESDNPELFKVLNIDIVKSRCRYFQAFLTNLDALRK